MDSDAVEQDLVLLKRLRGGDPDAFSQLMNRLLPQIERYVYRLTRSREVTDDVVQETFLRLWHSNASFDPAKAKLSTWLHRIAHNLCVDHFRKSARLAPQDDEWEWHEQRDSNPITPSSMDPDTQLEQANQQQALGLAMARLPERQRSALVLAYYQGFSNQEVASILDLSVQAVESLLARARKNLKAALQ